MQTCTAATSVCVPTSPCRHPAREGTAQLAATWQCLGIPAESVLWARDGHCSMHVGRGGCSQGRCRARKGWSLPGRSLPGVQAGFASWWTQSACICSSDALPHTRVFSWSPQGNTILRTVYSSRRMKCRDLGSTFTSHFCSSLAIGRSCIQSC